MINRAEQNSTHVCRAWRKGARNSDMEWTLLRVKQDSVELGRVESSRVGQDDVG
jgi:hypothetical protein